MLLSPDKGTQIISNNERAINDILLQLISRPPSVYSSASQYDLIERLEEIADMRFGDPPLPRMAGFYSGPLYYDMFVADPIGNMRYRIERLKRKYHMIWFDHDPERVAAAVRQFHLAFAAGCETGNMDRLVISSLVNQFVADFNTVTT